MTIKGKITPTVRISHCTENLKKVAIFIKCSLYPANVISSLKCKYANSCAANCKIIVENPKSAKTANAAILINVYQYPCSVGVKYSGINISTNGPATIRHN